MPFVPAYSSCSAFLAQTIFVPLVLYIYISIYLSF
jgi:hypothetical protein